MEKGRLKFFAICFGKARVLNQEDKTPPKRTYPPVYEKVLPFALGMVALLIFVLILISLIVVLGIFPGS